MIDIVRAKKAFKEYVKNYNPNDGKKTRKMSPKPYWRWALELKV